MSYFGRKNGYESDYEKMMKNEGFKKVDNYGKQHNVLIFEKDTKEGIHEHAGYDPKTGKTFWHGNKFETKHNRIESKEKFSAILEKDLFDENKKGEYIYEKDEYGLRAYGNLKLDDSVKRNGYAQRTVGGEARLEDDDGGHLIGNRFAGSSEKENLVPQNRNLNRGGYKHFENEIEKKLKEGKKVYMDVQTYSHEGEERPTAFMINEIDEDLNGKRNWEAVSYTNVSSLEQAQWEKEIVEMDEKKDE